MNEAHRRSMLDNKSKKVQTLNSNSESSSYSPSSRPILGLGLGGATEANTIYNTKNHYAPGGGVNPSTMSHRYADEVGKRI